MSDPVVWMVKSKRGLIRGCWYEKPSDEQAAIAAYDGATITPLYTVDAIERKDAVIAELVDALKSWKKAGIGNSVDWVKQAHAYANGQELIAKHKS